MTCRQTNSSLPNPLQEPGPDPSVTLPPHEALARLIRMQIEEDGPIPFDRFMEYALYHPEFGYYTRHDRDVRAGAQGDFITAPTLSPLFGAALARFVAAAWERLGKPLSWWYVEAGAGTGALSRPLLAALKESHGAAAHGMHVALTDQHPGHRALAERNLKQVVPEGRLHVSDSLPRLEGRPTVIIANELLDNLPVRLLYHRAEGWAERCVTILPDGGFTWADTPAPETLKEWVASFGVEPPTNHQVEIPVGTRDWLERMTKELDDAPSVLLLIDYGEVARDLLSEPRPQGTVMAYERHEQDRDVLREPGNRDVTAHVNWSAVARAARDQGWHEIGYTKQGAFLADLGLLEEAARIGGSVSSESQFAALQAVKEVLLPGGMGESFKVLGVVRGADAEGSWPGFADRRHVDPPPRG